MEKEFPNEDRLNEFFRKQFENENAGEDAGDWDTPSDKVWSSIAANIDKTPLATTHYSRWFWFAGGLLAGGLLMYILLSEGSDISATSFNGAAPIAEIKNRDKVENTATYQIEENDEEENKPELLRDDDSSLSDEYAYAYAETKSYNSQNPAEKSDILKTKIAVQSAAQVTAEPDKEMPHNNISGKDALRRDAIESTPEETIDDAKQTAASQYIEMAKQNSVNRPLPASLPQKKRKYAVITPHRNDLPFFMIPVLYKSIIRNQYKAARGEFAIGVSYGALWSLGSPVKGNKLPVTSHITQSKAAPSFTTGLDIGYRLSANWRINSGLHYYQFNNMGLARTRIIYTERGATRNRDGRIINTYDVPLTSAFGSTDLELSVSNVKRHDGRDIREGEPIYINLETKLRVQYISIPVAAGYEWAIGKFSVGVYAGAIANFLHSGALSVRSLRLDRPRLTPNKVTVRRPLQHLESFQLDMQGGINASYNVYDHFDLVIKSGYRQALSPVFTNKRFSTKPSMVSLNAGLQYNF